MRRFRTQWLALLGALVILSLSLGSAFGARPLKADGESLTFGQQVSAFVHSLQSTDQDGDEEQTRIRLKSATADGDSPTDETPDEDSGETPADVPGDTDQDGAEDSDDSDDVADEADGSEDVAGDEDGTDACDTDEDADGDEAQETPTRTLRIRRVRGL